MSNELLHHFLQVTDGPATKIEDERKPEESEAFSENELEKINNKILEELSQVVSEKKFNTYFYKNLKLLQIDSDQITFLLPTQFMKTIIAEQFMAELDDAVINVLGHSYKIQFSVAAATHKSLSSNDQSILRSTQEVSLPRSVKEVSFTLDLEKNSDDIKDSVESRLIKEKIFNSSSVDKLKTFDNFIFGPSNQMAYSVCKAISLHPGKKYATIFIHSDSGLGKTHLLHAVANEISSNYPSLNVQLISAKDLISEMITALRFQKMDEIHTKYSRYVDVLMIDDIQILRKTEGIQDQFFHLFNELYNQKKQLIFTADKNPRNIEGIEERIKTRLQWGLVIDIQKPDLETRIAILKRKAQDIDLFLTEDILTLIATHINSSIRELEGAIIRLSAHCEMMNQEIDCEMVKEILRLDSYKIKVELTLEDIARPCAQHFDVTLADLKSKSRDQRFTYPRHLAMYIAYEKFAYTYKEIGQFFNRDHSSVMSACEKIRENLKTDPKLSKDLGSVEEKF